MTSKNALFAAALILAACAPPPASQAQQGPPPVAGSLFASAPAQQVRVHSNLREISGLAITRDGRVFGHNDELGYIHEINPNTGDSVKSFALGDPVAHGDFEGIAITPSGDFYLATSQGLVLRFREGADRATVSFETIDTGLGGVCEIEGLAYFAAENSLILACKRNNDRAMRDTVSLYAWPLGARNAQAAPFLSVPEDTLTAATGVRNFRSSSVEIDPQSGRILLLSGNDGALAELNRAGEVLSARALAASHRQAEGVTVLRDGALLIADEGGDGAGLLSRYARIP